MKKFVSITILIVSFLLTACRNTSLPKVSGIPEQIANKAEQFGTQTETESESVQTDNLAKHTMVSQEGPYGELSISIPNDWKYELLPVDSEELSYGMYGIHFYPSEIEKGFIEVVYMDSFDVCGTGLEEEMVVIAGESANIGTYDNHDYWDFISFRGEKEGIKVFTDSVDEWWGKYENQVLDIINTLSFDPDKRTGGAYVYDAEAEIPEIKLQLSLKHITATGATLVFYQYDKNAPKGELLSGEYFVLEQLINDTWEEVPIVVEGNYGFNDIGYMIPTEDTVTFELDWSWLYGELGPGEYRILKHVNDLIESGNYKLYTVYAHFILN